MVLAMLALACAQLMTAVIVMIVARKTARAA
jgi:hypothetical protein